jgi:hypothetical protein
VHLLSLRESPQAMAVILPRKINQPISQCAESMAKADDEIGDLFFVMFFDFYPF